jgi:hypothetical protein
MKTIFAVVILALSLAAVAQEKPTEKPSLPVLTAQEQLHLRNLQVVKLNALQAYQSAIQQLPEYRAAQEAQTKLDEAVAELYKAHRVDAKTINFCDGPSVSGCSEFKVGEMGFGVPPAQQATK